MNRGSLKFYICCDLTPKSCVSAAELNHPSNFILSLFLYIYATDMIRDSNKMKYNLYFFS